MSDPKREVRDVFIRSVNAVDWFIYSWASLVVQLVKKSSCSVGDLGSVPELGRSPGEGNGYPL